MPVTDKLQRPRNGWPALVAEARKYMGTNPTDRKKLWCATFMNLVLHKLGYAGTNSDAARSFAYYGHRVSSPQVGAIAVLSRGRNGGHVGVVTGVDPHGNPIIISGNHGHRVGEGVYPRSRVIAYVMPTEQRPVTQVADRSSPRAAGSAAASGPDIDSPISELIAAIEAEQDKPEAAKPQKPQKQSRVAQAEAPRAGESSTVMIGLARIVDMAGADDAPRAGETPHTAEVPRAAEAPAREQPGPAPHRLVQQTPDQGAVDATVADAFGLKDRSAAPVPPGRVPQRKRSGRVAAN